MLRARTRPFFSFASTGDTFEVVAGTLAQPHTPGVRFGPYRTVSFDGCSSIKAPDSERNRGWLGRCSHGGYPQIELMTLVETGTRAVIGAVFGPTAEGETTYATRLLHHLNSEMLVLWDRGFDGNDFLAAVHTTGARVLGRITQLTLGGGLVGVWGVGWPGVLLVR